MKSKVDTVRKESKKVRAVTIPDRIALSYKGNKPLSTITKQQFINTLEKMNGVYIPTWESNKLKIEYNKETGDAPEEKRL